jgi:hypothetical protein
VIESSSLAEGVDTIIELYNVDGVTLVGSDDNGGEGNASRLVWGAPGDGLYYIRVVPAAGSAYGCSAAYALTVATADITPPGAITDLSASTGAASGTVDLTWTAPGDDGDTGTASSYLVRYSGAAITEANWASATPVTTGVPAPASAGTSQSMTVTGLTPGQTYYFAVKAQDEAGNTSAISNSPSAMAGDGGVSGFRVYVPTVWKGG